MSEVVSQTTDCMLTTTDNPYNPFTHFDEWYEYDVAQGYNTCSYLARIVMTSYELDDEEQESDIERAIDEIVSLNILGIYKKVIRENNEGNEGNNTENEG